MCRCSMPCGIVRRLAAFPLITLNTNIIIVNAPPHSWALISCCATVLLGMAQWSGDVWWRPIVHNLIGRRACVAVDTAAAVAADAKQMRAISAGGAGSIRPDIKLNCRTEERAAGEQCDQVP